MATKSRKSTGKPVAKAVQPAKTAGAKATDGLTLVKSFESIDPKSPLGKAAAKVQSMRDAGDGVYFGVNAEGTPVFAIRKTGQRTSQGPRGRHICTLHTVANGELSKPLATARSVRAGWKNP